MRLYLKKEEDQKKVFKKFGRLEKSTYICKVIERGTLYE